MVTYVAGGDPSELSTLSLSALENPLQIAKLPSADAETSLPPPGAAVIDHIVSE
jgi:hypothetical protein